MLKLLESYLKTDGVFFFFFFFFAKCDIFLSVDQKVTQILFLLKKYHKKSLLYNVNHLINTTVLFTLWY